MEGRAYFREIDVMRGILAVLVVLGHTIQQYGASLGEGMAAVLHCLYGFHMAAFVFASGLCSGRCCTLETRADKRSMVFRRARRLLIPYFVWAAVYFVLRAVAGSAARIPYDYADSWMLLVGYNPDGAMWFLWTLFAASAILVAFAGILSRAVFQGVLFVVYMLLVMFVIPGSDSIKTAALRSLPLFVLMLAFGASMRSVYAEFRRWMQKGAVMLAVLVTFVVLCIIRHYGWWGRVPWFALTAVSGTLTVYALSSRLSDAGGVLPRVLAFLGKYAMAVYVLGEPVKVGCRILFARLGVPLWPAFAGMMVVTLVVPVLLSRYVLGFSRWLPLVFLGEDRK